MIIRRNRTCMKRHDPATYPSRGRRRWRRWVVGGMIVAAVVFHATILRWLARTLIVDDTRRTVDDVLVLDRGDCFDRAAELYHAGLASRLHFIERPAKRLESLGVVPSWGSLCNAELKRRRVSPRAITAIPGIADVNDTWQMARCTRAWLKDHPDDTVRVLCGRFSSGGIRYVMSKTLAVDDLDRVVFCGVPNLRYDESNWWQSRAGCREIVAALFDQAYFRLHGEDSAVLIQPFDPDAFERGLKLPLAP